jgi:hypothetical protein
MDDTTTVGRREPTLNELMALVREKPTLPKYRAGRLLGWGRRSVDEAIEAGAMPCISGPRDMVPCAWLRRQLRLNDEA